MSDSFVRIEMLSAQHGDCLWVEYGDSTCAYRFLIDGGPIGAFSALEQRVNNLPSGDKNFELIVLSHVDTDHTDGLIRLFAGFKPSLFAVKDVWFNGWRHLEPAHGLLGGRQGEFFSALLARRLPEGHWNGAFNGQAVVVPDQSALPERVLAGGLKLTLLSPTPATLSKMREAWRKAIDHEFGPGDLEAAWERLAQQRRFRPGEGLLGSTPELDALLEKQSRPDRAAANGASIAFLAEFADKRCLFLADAHPNVICASLKRLLKDRGLERLAVDAVKVSHHGSKGNTTDELLSLIESPRFLFSTNGAQFKHPDREAVQRIIGRSRDRELTLYFNYKTKFNEGWEDEKLQAELRYATHYHTDEGAPLVLTI
ncbi:MAG: hypothetical protein IPK64_22225 [bacterium]|nr:hypothetical protein [bacterium]